ncbi:MAG: folylpolyglutamate synthase/dihydrofolate synthase family protein [Litorimonas sp.]
MNAHTSKDVSEQLANALATLTALHPKKIDLGLGRILRVLEKLDNPQHKLPPTIHVAGTNGKGSTVAFIKAMCEADGLKVHAYNSPHLVRFNERITIASKQIEDAVLLDVIDRVRAANDGQDLSFFEATTAAAFLAFSEHPADIAIIEVGLGGRFDATNIFDPAVCAITPIDYDHAEFLGRDLAGIAREKAGIIKPYTPVFIGKQRELSRAVLDGQAGKHRASIQFLGEDFQAYAQHGRMVFESDDTLLDLPAPALLGAHQFENAGLAIAVARHMKISDKAISKGLSHAVWPARMQSLSTGPLAGMAVEVGAELLLDGGHNPHAARAIATTVAELEAKTARPLILITGILANKDIGGFLDAFSGLASAVIGVSIGGHTSLAPETLSELAQSRGMIGQVADNLTDAMQRAINTGLALSRETLDTPTVPPRILICGSLYLAGEVLKDNS